MLVGTNLKYAKAYNFRIVLETIRRFGPLPRADVARRTELTAQTVSNITRELLQAGLVREADLLREGRGAPATLLALNPDGAYSIGLDLDQDHLTGVLVDFVGEVRQRVHYDLDFPSPDEAMDLLEQTARDLISEEGLTKEAIWGVGVGLPGPFDILDGRVVSNVVNPKASPGWKNVPVADTLHARLGLPIFLENNATAAAVGERWYGAGQQIGTFFYLFFGVGLGGGLIIDGQPYDGHTGNAGELGYCHIPPVGDAGPDDVFDRPHLGILFDVSRLYRLLREDGVEISRPEQLAPLYRDGQPTLVSWLEAGAQHLAPIILAIEYLLDPETIFFGGRLPDVLLRGLMDRLQSLMPGLRIRGKDSVPVLQSATAGVDAAALGVATLPMYTAFAPAPSVLLKGQDHPVRATFQHNHARVLPT